MFEDKLVIHLKRFNSALHVLLAVALVAASVLVVLEFTLQVIHSLANGELALGFLHALGVLFIVWTLSSLISAEIEFVQTNRFHLRVFIEVAMITLLRQLIVEPIQMASRSTTGTPSDFDVLHYGALLGAILVVGIVHKLVGDTSAPRHDRAPAERSGTAD